MRREDHTRTPAPVNRARDRGQVALEYLGFIPLLILVAMAALQLGLIVYTAQQAGTAARTAARSAALGNPGWQQDGKDAVSGWLADGTSFGPPSAGEEVTVTATVQIPSIVPGWNFDPARKTATMPNLHELSRTRQEPRSTHP